MDLKIVGAIVFGVIFLLANKDAIIGFFKKPSVVVPPKVDDVVTPIDLEVTDIPKIEEVVKQWSLLKDMCQKSGLSASYEALDDVFLNLLNKKE